MTPHKWHLGTTAEARKQVSALDAVARAGIFRAIRELLLADNPALAPQVKKLYGPRFKGLWRKRQGRYRVFFEIDPTEITHEKFLYKGTVTIVRVVDRKNAY